MAQVQFRTPLIDRQRLYVLKCRVRLLKKSSPVPTKTIPMKPVTVLKPVTVASDSLPAEWQQTALAIVIPTYNEAENLQEMAQAIFSLPLPKLSLVIVDDNSPDGTGRMADQLVAHYNAGGQERMKVIHRTGKGGLGTAYVAGMQQALANGAEFVLQMDADFSHSPGYIPQMLGVMLSTGADVIIGSRYVPGGSLDEGWSWWRRLLSWWANLYSRAVLRIRVRDMTAGFKLWRSEALVDIGLRNVRSNGYIFQVEMAYLSEKLGYRIIEVPIHFEDRRIGQSKMDVPVKIESAWRVWELRWRHRKRVRRTMEVANLTPVASKLHGSVTDGR
jgi:dolichol-phosphate mannosyltransferase